jgi:DNA-binding NarL/FixJ family response regulator
MGVALSRSDRDFTVSERDLLNLIRPYLIQAYRNALDHTRLSRSAGGINLEALASLGLTRRQAEVLRLVAMGRSDQDAADELGIAPRTAQKHMQLAYRTLGVTERSQAARLAWDLTEGIPSRVHP